MNGAASSRPAVVVVGASRGIGRAIAKVAAREQCPVVLAARAPDALAAVAGEVRAAGGEPFILEIDLFTAAAPKRLQAYLESADLYCDVLVNSAGYGLRGAATLLPADEQIGMVDVNIRALSDMTLHFLPAMCARKRGGVLNLGSIASFTPGPGMAMYYATKGFVRSFSEALHEEVRATGVTVTCAAPGPVATEFLQRSGAGRSMLFKVLPRLDADYVAERAWRGFRSGRRLVVPGISAKLAAFTASVIPHMLLLPLIGKLQRRSGDPCPCGSGKRYSECCGKRGAGRRAGRISSAKS